MTKSSTLQKIEAAKKEKDQFYKENAALIKEWERHQGARQAILENIKKDILKCSCLVGTDEYHSLVEIDFSSRGYRIESLEFNEEDDSFELGYRGLWTEADLRFMVFEEENLYPEKTP